MQKLNEMLRTATERLVESDIPDAANDAWILMEFCYNISRTQYYMDMLKEKDEKPYYDMVKRRMKHEPLQYITGEQNFMGYTFEVNESVLIPRQDTEVLVEHIYKVVGNNEKTVLDMCTGSGCIAISIAKLCGSTTVDAADISEAALKVARQNNVRNQANVNFMESNLFEKIDKKYDVIVSNPPYIPSKDIEALMEEVKNHEPMLALDGNEDGLDFYREITKESVKHLNDNGFLFYEIGYDQGSQVKQILIDNGFTKIRVLKDLAGLDRIVEGQYSSTSKKMEVDKDV